MLREDSKKPYLSLSAKVNKNVTVVAIVQIWYRALQSKHICLKENQFVKKIDQDCIHSDWTDGGAIHHSMFADTTQLSWEWCHSSVLMAAKWDPQLTRLMRSTRYVPAWSISLVEYPCGGHTKQCCDHCTQPLAQLYSTSLHIHSWKEPCHYFFLPHTARTICSNYTIHPENT
jgi:hypothetical protein